MSTPTPTSENSLKNWSLLVILTLIWGSSFILIKRGLEVFSPGEVGAYRMVAAASLLLPLSLPRIKQLSKTQVKNLLVTGLLGSFIPASMQGAYLSGIRKYTKYSLQNVKVNRRVIADAVIERQGYCF